MNGSRFKNARAVKHARASKKIVQVADALSPENCRRPMTMYDRLGHLTEVRDQNRISGRLLAVFRDAADAAKSFRM